MKFEDVLNEDGTVKEFYALPVKDEKFKQDIYLNTKVKEALLDYVQSIGVKRENYVFQSNKTPNYAPTSVSCIHNRRSSWSCW